MPDTSAIPALQKLVPKDDDVRFRFSDGSIPRKEIAARLLQPVRRFVSPGAWPESLQTHPGEPPATAIHSHGEIHFLLSGEMLFALDGALFLAQRGDMVFVPGWTSHGGRPLQGPENVLDLVFHFNATPLACINESPETPDDTIIHDSHVFISGGLSEEFR